MNPLFASTFNGMFESLWAILVASVGIAVGGFILKKRGKHGWGLLLGLVGIGLSGALFFQAVPHANQVPLHYLIGSGLVSMLNIVLLITGRLGKKIVK